MTVYTKTARGLDEIAHRSNAIGLRARRVLILIDGARTLDALQALSGDSELAATLAQLEEAGFIAGQGLDRFSGVLMQAGPVTRGLADGIARFDPV